jgi:hypothetical protein
LLILLYIVTFRELCSTMFPDVKYPAKNSKPDSSSSKNDSNSTKACSNQPKNILCNSLSLFDFDFGSKFEEFISPYEQDEIFRKEPIKPIILEEYPKPITSENDLIQYFDVFSYAFLGRIVHYDQKHKLIFERTSFGNAHFYFMCHDFASFVQIELDSKFVTCELN